MVTVEALSKNSDAPAMAGARLNSAQIHLLQLLSHIQTDDTLKDLKRLIRDHYARQLHDEADKHWSEGNISDDLLNKHLRTEYK